jgi:alkylation response protein AidB-like acyl-CoA dehydrogenase
MIQVPSNAPGVKVLRSLSVFGYDDALHGRVEIELGNVRVSASNILLGEGRGFEIAMIKVLAPTMTLQVIDWAMQAHGGAGVSDDFPLAMMYVHSRTLSFADDPDEVHRNAIAKLELAKHMSVPKSAKTA